MPEKMRVNIGGDPERDDYGLPPVDIEIPDDARELDRDVQAYHRELRAQRRHRLAQRLGGPLTRDGMVLPLLAGCLALTLLAGTLLTVFTRSARLPQHVADGQRAAAVPAAVGQVGGHCRQPASPSAAISPPRCALPPARCWRWSRPAASARQPAPARRQAAAAEVKLYFVGWTAGDPGRGPGPPQRPQRRPRGHRQPRTRSASPTSRPG